MTIELIESLIKDNTEFNKLFSNFTTSHNIIYILKLENNKYYVGKTKNILIRYKQHTYGNGSFWTKKYKPINIDKLIYDCDDFDEDKYVKIYMSIYGIDNVRGGTYIQEKLSKNTQKFIISEIRMAENKCLLCGSTDHFAKTCIYKHNFFIRFFLYIINFININKYKSNNYANNKKNTKFRRNKI